MAIGTAERVAMSAVNYLEVATRIDRRDSILLAQKFDAFMALSAIEVLPISRSQTRLARLACAEFGKGRHPARLNLGDCFAYALAKETGLPLLFKGEDFVQTDIRAAV